MTDATREPRAAAAAALKYRDPGTGQYVQLLSGFRGAPGPPGTAGQPGTSGTGTAAGEAGGRYIDVAGDILTGPLNLGGNSATRLAPGSEPDEAASMQQLADITGPRYAQISGSSGPPTQGELWVNTSRKTFEWDTEWRTPSYQNGWAPTFNGDNAKASFRKLPDGRVMWHGQATNGAGAADQAMISIPPGYRPGTGNACLIFVQFAWTNKIAHCRVDVTPTELVLRATSDGMYGNLAVTLDGIIYYPEA